MNFPEWILDAAKRLNTKEMRDLYRAQKKSNPDFDSDIKNLSEEIEKIFQHTKDSYMDKKKEKGDSDE